MSKKSYPTVKDSLEWTKMQMLGQKKLLRRAIHCIGRESNPGLAESLEMISLMATANFTTKPPMLIVIVSARVVYM